MIELEEEVEKGKRPKKKMQEGRQTERGTGKNSELKKTRIGIPVLN
jgi:hypothetical protein